jgi:uncharacterized membrane-anchored protein
MNKTQRRALFTLSISLMLIVFGVIIFNSMFTPGDKTTGVKLVKVWMWLIMAASIGGAVFVHLKRRTPEVDSDERDRYIKKNAILVSFISLWILLFASSLIPGFIAGDMGSIPVDLLPIINVGIFFVALLVYSVAVLVQYGWGAKGEQS